jgi:hypothetical protein
MHAERLAASFPRDFSEGKSLRKVLYRRAGKKALAYFSFDAARDTGQA